MTVSLKHKFHSPLPDGVNPSLIRPSNWNDEHDLTIPENTIVGRVESGEGPATALTQAEVIAFLGDDVGGIDSVEEDPAPKLGGDLDLNGHKIPGIDYDDLTNKPTLGSAAAADTGDFATAAQGALADSALQNVVEDTTPQLGGDLDANGKKITWNSGGVTIEYSASTLKFSGAPSGYEFDRALTLRAAVPSISFIDTDASGTAQISGNSSAASITISADTGNVLASSAINFSIDGAVRSRQNATDFSPSTSDGSALGSTSLRWADLRLALGAVIDFDADVTVTHSAGFLTVNKDVRITTPGTNSASVLTRAAISTDGTLAGNSDTDVPSEKAVRTYVDNNAGGATFSAEGDGSTDVTTEFYAFLNAGGGIIPAGTYIVGSGTVSSPFRIQCAPGVIIKQKASTQAATHLWTWTSGASGSTWIGGTFDGNKANQDFFASAFHRFNNVDDITLDGITYQNCMGLPFLTTEINRMRMIGLVKDCNFTCSINGQTTAGGDDTHGNDCMFNLRIEGTNNNGHASFQHAFDAQNMRASKFNIRVVGQGADDSGSSTFASGITLIHNRECTYDLKYLDHVVDEVYTLGVSFVDERHSVIRSLIANKCRQTVEVVGGSDVTFLGGDIDCEYWTTTAVPDESSLTGFILHAGGFYPPSAVSLTVTAPRRIKIANFNIRRCGTGIMNNIGEVDFSAVTVIGADLDGFRFTKAASSTDAFPGQAAPSIENITCNGCVARNCGRAGLMIDSVSGLTWSGGALTNNGQDTSATSTLRSGWACQGSDTKSRITVRGATIGDLQGSTKTLAASFKPGTTDANNRYVFSVLSGGLLDVGQRITLVGAASGSTDATGRIVDYEVDEMTVQFDDATTFIAATTSLSGTFSSSGTTLTGTSSSLESQVTGRCWLRHVASGEYRQVMKVVSDTSAVLDEPFTADLSGATLTRVRCDITTIKSQQYGGYWDSHTTQLDAGDNNYVDNVVARMHGASALNAATGLVAAGAKIWLHGSGDFAAATTTNLYASIPIGYKLIGGHYQVTTAIGGADGTVALSLVGGTGKSLASSLALAKNTKSEFAADYLTDASTQLRATISGGSDNVPSSGSYRCELLAHRFIPEVYADAA